MDIQSLLQPAGMPGGCAKLGALDQELSNQSGLDQDGELDSQSMSSDGDGSHGGGGGDMDESQENIGSQKKKYSVISQEVREKFIQRVISREVTIKEAAREFGIKFSTSKAILQTFKREGRIGKKKTRQRKPKTSKGNGYANDSGDSGGIHNNSPSKNPDNPQNFDQELRQLIEEMQGIINKNSVAYNNTQLDSPFNQGQQQHKSQHSPKSLRFNGNKIQQVAIQTFANPFSQIQHTPTLKAEEDEERNEPNGDIQKIKAQLKSLSAEKLKDYCQNNARIYSPDQNDFNYAAYFNF